MVLIFAPIRSSLSLEIQSIPSPGGRGSLFTRGACLIFYIHVSPIRWAPFWGRLVIRPRVYSRKYSNCLKCGNVNIKVLYTVHDTSMKLQTIIVSNSKKVLQIQMEKALLYFLFEILESHLQRLPVKCPATVHGYLG